MKWQDNHIIIDKVSRPKKITGTRFGAILNQNKWSTPFATWCDITKTYVEPYEDTIYTIAGKTIEPKQIEYMQKVYHMDDLRTPTDLFGKDFFNKTHGNFFDHPVLGGMWDSITVGDDGKPNGVLEFKTTKRAEDWSDGEIPEYYALQAALYGYLLGVDDVYMVVSFLEEGDYDHPEDYTPNASNTAIRPFKISERYPDFEHTHIQVALDWWSTYVEGKMSPDFDEKADAEILKELRKNDVDPDAYAIGEIVARAEELTVQLSEYKKKIKPLEDELKKLKESIKNAGLELFRDGDTAVSIEGKKFDWVVSMTEKASVNEEKLKEDGLYESYATITPSYRLTSKAKNNKEDK